MALGALIAILVAFGSGFHYGGKNCRANYAAEQLRQEAEAKEARASINAEDAKADTKTVVRSQKRQAQQQVVIREVIKHVQTLPDPVECALAPERVRNINTAFGFATDTGSEAATVPQADPAKEWKPQ